MPERAETREAIEDLLRWLVDGELACPSCANPYLDARDGRLECTVCGWMEDDDAV